MSKRGTDHDPLAAARARAAEYRQHLIEEAGGVFGLSEASEALGVTPQAVTGRRQRGTILAVTLPNGDWVYPAAKPHPTGWSRGWTRSWLIVKRLAMDLAGRAARPVRALRRPERA